MTLPPPGITVGILQHEFWREHTQTVATGAHVVWSHSIRLCATEKCNKTRHICPWRCQAYKAETDSEALFHWQSSTEHFKCSRSFQHILLAYPHDTQ